jgi:hypothetical protein
MIYSRFTSLYLNLTRYDDPLKGFSETSYEKSAQFLYYMEQFVMEAKLMQKFLTTYVLTFK